ncbi:PRC-barrel domain containing protein [Streptomyces sp. NPDC002187]|uniref:PRC-barrel domain containing protein n=1 Tax=Streptomyces sp. NPDC002187 TaxID=3364637 RepID=UPI003677D05F
MSESIWNYPSASGHAAGIELAGFKVEALDGSIGRVDKHSDDVGSAYLVVDIGIWIFGKHVLLPAGTVTRIDTAGETIFVSRTKDQIKAAPEFNKEEHVGNPELQDQIGKYYGSHRA